MRFSCTKCGFETDIGGGVPHPCRERMLAKVKAKREDPRNNYTRIEPQGSRGQLLVLLLNGMGEKLDSGYVWSMPAAEALGAAMLRGHADGKHQKVKS